MLVRDVDLGWLRPGLGQLLGAVGLSNERGARRAAVVQHLGRV